MKYEQFNDDYDPDEDEFIPTDDQIEEYLDSIDESIYDDYSVIDLYINITFHAVFQLVIQVTSAVYDGKRHIDIIDAFNADTCEDVGNIREIIPSDVIEEALELYIWSIENDDMLSDEEREMRVNALR